MAGSFKDALRKSGLAPPAPAPAKVDHRRWREELPEDETLPPLFDAPALTVPSGAPAAPPPTKK